MSLFGAIPIAGSGVDAAQTWLDVTAGNVANMNDAVPGNETPYEAQYAIASPDTSTDAAGVGQGVNTSVVTSDSPGDLVQDPGNPIADAQGDVRYPEVDMGTQMVNMTMAQTAYQMNVSVINQAKTAYQSALMINE